MHRKDTIRPFIIQTMAMDLSEIEALSYLEDRGFTISRESYYRYKRKIKNSRFERLSLIAKQGFVDQHLERIDQLELIDQEYWKLYRQEKDNFKKAQILEKIAELQTYISPYYDASRYVMEKSIQDENKKDSKSISTV
jgi:DNA repair ATPase RecN